MEFILRQFPDLSLLGNSPRVVSEYTRVVLGRIPSLPIRGTGALDNKNWFTFVEFSLTKFSVGIHRAKFTGPRHPCLFHRIDGGIKEAERMMECGEQVCHDIHLIP
jgi:hypothetical protein